MKDYYCNYDPESYDSYTEEDKLSVVDGETLANYRFERQDYLVNTLLQPGLCILSGAPKVGKSWLVLHLCMQVAKGEPFLGLDVRQGDVLYITMEDTARRIHRRINTITEESSPHLYVTNSCARLGNLLFWQLQEFINEHPDTRLIVIDTYQLIRDGGKDTSYSNDYSETREIKEFADCFGVCVLLVHHNRKMPDEDFANVISGTTGIAGSCDTIMVLQKEKRKSREATLSCTGRDIEDRELKMELDRKTCTWSVKSDSLTGFDEELPEEIELLIAFMRRLRLFYGSPTEFAAMYNEAAGLSIRPNQLTRLMNLNADVLEDHGVSFLNKRIKNVRMLQIQYSADQDRSLESCDGSFSEKGDDARTMTGSASYVEKPTVQAVLYDETMKTMMGGTIMNIENLRLNNE